MNGFRSRIIGAVDIRSEAARVKSPVMHSYGIRWQNGAENGELFLRVPSSILMSVTFDHEEGGGINSD